MSGSIFDALGSALLGVLAPAIDAAEDPAALEVLLDGLGSSPDDPAGAVLAAACKDLVDLSQQIEGLSANQSPSFADISHLLESAKQAVLAIRALDNGSATTAALTGIGKDLADLLIGIYVSGRAPLFYRICVLLTLVDAPEDIAPTSAITSGGVVVRASVSFPRFYPERLIALIQDPESFLKSQYLTPLQTDDDAAAMADKLFPRISGLLRVLGMSTKYGLMAEEAALYGSNAPWIDHALTLWVTEEVAGATADAGFMFTLSPAARGDLGFVISPFGTIEFTESIGDWGFEVDFSAAIEALAIGRRGTIVAASEATADVSGKFVATLAAPGSGPAFVAGSPTGTRLEVGGAKFELDLAYKNSTFSYGMSGAVTKSAVVISPGDGDGFLQSVLPAGGLKADFDLGLAWSNTGGLSFHGAAGLDATLPVGISIGGVITIPTIHLGLQAGDAGLLVEVSTSIGLSIGPVQALVDRLGLTANVTFPDGGGNLGIADLDFSFKLPSGVGLAINYSGVTGAGVLSRDPAKHEYNGMLQLEFDDVALQAFGLITTQVAGGSGYSLLAMIDADFPPVQLGWGFTLNGAGGLLAVHRTADTDKLRAALKADKLATILFPKSAISNAPLVLAQLDALFPTAQGRFLFGPMALIGWGTPTVLTVALAVILELPEPIRILLLARLAVRLPSATAPLVTINMDALGVLDLSQRQFSLDATLYDSKITGFTLSGDMALRANWGMQREFLLAIGGFHPQFTPPAGFPSLQRVTIDMPSGSISKLRLAAYLAITSNTLQFGADLDVFIGVSGFGLAGHLAFDAMLQYVPLHFDADISASIALMAGGDTLMSVGLDATLSGPGPWNIAGKFKIHFFFFDIHISFSKTWGDDTPAVPIEPVDVLALLTAAFEDSRNWGTLLPDNVPALVSLRSHDGATVIAHPMALLEVHERIVPLDLQIARFGAAPVYPGASIFSITSFTVGTWSGAGTKVLDDFAPAQFFDLTDEEKLEGPSFERHDAGVRMDSLPAKSAPQVLVKTITYETWYVDKTNGTLREDSGQKQSVPLKGGVRGNLLFGASGRAAIWSAGNRRYKTNGTGNKVAVKPLTFTIASTATLASAGMAPAADLTYSAAKAVLAKAVANQPGSADELQVVALHEMAVS